MHRGILEPDLDRTRDVPFAPPDHAAFGRRPEFGNQLVRVEAPHDDVAFLARGPALAAAMHPEIALGQTVPAVFGKLDQLAHQVGEAVLAIGGQSHDLVFLAERIEADVLAQRGVEEPEAVGQPDLIEHLDPVALASRRHHRDEIARRVV